MKTSFNLIDQPWIPCVPAGGGAVVEVGIREALTNASAYGEIYDNSPLVTVSLHRLLLAILYRACGPANLREARALIRDGMPADVIHDYLNKWHDRFDLFDEEHPFYQTSRLVMEKPSNMSRLATELATGNNATLFDHTDDVQAALYACSEAARLLVAAQSFALGFGKSSEAEIAGVRISPPYSADGILLRGMTVWLSGSVLSETLLLNLMHTPRDASIPCWELDSPHELRDETVGANRITRSAEGLIDRYTWQSRLIRLLPTVVSGNALVSQVYFTQGRSADKTPGDPMKVYSRDEKAGFLPVQLSPAKSSWRDAHAILTSDTSASIRPPVIDDLANVFGGLETRPIEEVNVNVVGLATSAGKAGKFVLWRHDRMSTPLALLQDADLVERLGTLLHKAEKVAKEMRQATFRLCSVFLSTSQKPSDPDSAGKLADKIDPRRDYWARLEKRFHELLRELPVDKDAASARWLQSVRWEAERAFAQSAGQLGQTARAIRARALVSPRFEAEMIITETSGEKAKEDQDD